MYNNSVTNETYVFPGCRVTVTHQFWELAQAGSTPVIPTISSAKAQFRAKVLLIFI